MSELCASESSEDTIILDSDETVPSDIDHILKKYSSVDSAKENGINTAQANSNLHEFSDDEWIEEPLIKRLKQNNETTSMYETDFKNNRQKIQTNQPCTSTVKLKDDFYRLSDDSCDLEDNDWGFKKLSNINNLLKEKYSVCDKVKCETSEEDRGKNSNTEDIYILSDDSNSNHDNFNKDSEDITTDYFLKDLYSKYNLGENLSPPSSSKESIESNKVNKKQNQKVDKEQKKFEREVARLEKIKKKEDAAKEKAVKEALRAVEKNLKPEECMKFITVNVDYGIFDKHYGDMVRKTLENSSMYFKGKSQTIPNLISWTRKIQSIEGEVVVSKEVEEKNLLILLDCKDFLKHVDENTLISQLQSIHTFTGVMQLSLGVYGLGNYYKFLKNKDHKDFQSEMRGGGKIDANCYKNYPNVNRSRVEYALTELQIIHSCYFRPLESYEDVSMIVMECTKAVAQLPYKLQKQEKYQQESEWFAGDNKDCVQVDKQGNGLSRLWTQILTLFPLARLETAEAIASVYPNPKSLIQEYEKCESREEGMKLLEELRVRRAAGPNTTVRKIGPELSKKVHNFFTSYDNILL